jgi:hypothetical protein
VKEHRKAGTKVIQFLTGPKLGTEEFQPAVGNHTSVASKITVKVEIAVEVKAIKGARRIMLEVEKLAQALMINAIAKFYQMVIQSNCGQEPGTVLAKASNHIGNKFCKGLGNEVAGVAKLEREFYGKERINWSKILEKIF